MSEILASIIGMSIAGGAAILIVLLIRLLFRPSGQICCVIWLLAGMRLLLPFSFADTIGLQLPEISISSERSTVYEMVPSNAHTAITVATDNSSSPASAVSSEIFRTSPAVSADRIIAFLWLAGAAAVAVCIIASFIRIRLRLRTAVRMEGNVYQSELIPSPFVFGLVRPRIYIPYSVDNRDIPYVLKHEKNHIKRKDHITKAAALAVLTVHWFNPLVWTAYLFLCRDIEAACDEKVIADMDIHGRRHYSTALLACSVGRRVTGCPVAFGAVSVKERITHIMKYTRPSFLRNLLSAVLCAALALCTFALPVGCAKTPASARPAVYEDIDTNDVHYKGTDRIMNDDGSITMLFMPQSNFSCDSSQRFCFDGDGSILTAEPTSGFITAPNEKGSVLYMTPELLSEDIMSGAYFTTTDEEGCISYRDFATSISVDANSGVIWIPYELNFDSGDGNINANIVFTSSSADGVQDTATVTVTTDETAITPESMRALTIRVDDNHILSIDKGDVSRTITISKAD